MEIGEIREQIGALELGADRASIVAGFEALDLLAARLAVAVGEYEAAGGHHDDGAVSMNGWLRHLCGRDHRTAAKLTVCSRKLRRLPVLRDAAVAGELSGGQLDAVLVNVPERHVDRFAEHEVGLVPILVDLPVDQTRHVMEHWQRRADALDVGPRPTEHANELHLSRTLDARGELRGSFDADTTAVVDAALRVADPHDHDLPLARRRADALAQVCQHFLDHQHHRVGGRHRPHLNVVVDVDDLDDGGTYLDTGQPVSSIGLEVLRCDSALHRVLTRGSSGILDYGRATRTWPTDLYNAVVLRDQGCRMPGCDAPASWCDVHHVVPWEHGGETALVNGVLLCRRHHRMTHQPGHHLKLLPDGTVERTLPDGTTESSRPRGPTAPSIWSRSGGT